MTNSTDKYKIPLKSKQFDDEILESSIFDILENDFQIGDLVWAKLNGFSWWPAFIYGCFSENWKYVKTISKPGLPTKKQYFVYCFGSHFKYGWVHQVSLCPYKGLEAFLSYCENQVEQATTRRSEEQIRKRFKVQLPESLHQLRKDAVTEADEILALPTNLRVTAFERMLQQLLTEANYPVPQQGKEKMEMSDNVSTGTSINEEQQSHPEGKKQSSQMLSSICNISKRTVSNQQVQVSSGTVGKPKRTFSFNPIRRETNEIEQSSKIQSKSYIMPTMNELDNDIVVVKINTPTTQSTTVSLTTAICHFLDKGIPSLTVYEEIRLVNELINHRFGSLLSLTDAQLFVEQYAINTALMNYKHEMLFVKTDFFYDFLLKYPQIILKHRQWFKDFRQTLMPLNNDKIQLKKWQLATLLHAHMNLEQRLQH